MDLLALADFNLVARHGGFGRAARTSGRPKATLSRRVSELESSLDLRLFERGTRALKLTQEGRALYERTAALLAELDETAAAIASGGDKPRGRLRISAPLLFSQTAMGKLAAAFALRYPEVRLEVTTEDRSVDMIEEGYDLVIRVNPDADEILIGRILMRDRLVVVASADLSRAKGDLAVPAVVRGTSDLKLRLGRDSAKRKLPDHDRTSASPVVAHHGSRRGSSGRRRRAPPRSLVVHAPGSRQARPLG